MTDPTPTPDTLDLRADGTIVWAWPETTRAPWGELRDADPDDGRWAELWTPAWTIVRPKMGRLFQLQSFYATLIGGLNEHAARLRDDLAAAAAAYLEDGTPVSETQSQKMLRDAEAENQATRDALWQWISAMLRWQGRPIGDHARPVEVDDMPAWAGLNYATFTTFVQHWQTVPLGPGPPPVATNGRTGGVNLAALRPR